MEEVVATTAASVVFAITVGPATTVVAVTMGVGRTTTAVEEEASTAVAASMAVAAESLSELASDF